MRDRVERSGALRSAKDAVNWALRQSRMGDTLLAWAVLTSKSNLAEDAGCTQERRGRRARNANAQCVAAASLESNRCEHEIKDHALDRWR
jgi:hypothetical protein